MGVFLKNFARQKRGRVVTLIGPLTHSATSNIEFALPANFDYTELIKPRVGRANSTTSNFYDKCCFFLYIKQQLQYRVSN